MVAAAGRGKVGAKGNIRRDFDLSHFGTVTGAYVRTEILLSRVDAVLVIDPIDMEQIMNHKNCGSNF
jgi:hypothetical protein